MKKKILNLSIDKKLFEEGSAVARRFVEYGKLFERFDAIVYTEPGFSKKELAPNVCIYPTNSRSKFSYFADAFRIASGIISKETIVSSQEAITNLVAVKIKRKLGNPFQAQVHTDFMSPYFRKESFKNFVRYRLYKKTIKEADYVRVVSKRILNSIQELLVKCPASRVHVVPLFVDKEELLKTANSEIPDTHNLKKLYPQFSFILLMVLRFEAEKNILMALRALKKVTGLYPKTGLVLVGKGSRLGEINREIERLGLSKNVAIINWTDSLAGYYKSANLFLVTSNYEGYGLTFLEAAYCDLPILTSDVGLTGELLEGGKDVVVCSVGDEDCFVNNIIELIENNDQRETLAFNAREKIEHELPTKEAYLKAYEAMFN